MILVLPGDPVPCPRPRASVVGGHAAIHMPSDYMAWKKKAALVLVNQFRTQGGIIGSGQPIRVSVAAVFDRPLSRPASIWADDWKRGGRLKRWSKPDADNLLKAVCDALQDAGIVSDDCKVEIGGVTRWYGCTGELPKVEITVEVL